MPLNDLLHSNEIIFLFEKATSSLGSSGSTSSVFQKRKPSKDEHALRNKNKLKYYKRSGLNFFSLYIPKFAIFIDIIDCDVSSLYLSEANSYCASANSILFCLARISPVNSWMYPLLALDE